MSTVQVSYGSYSPPEITCSSSHGIHHVDTRTHTPTHFTHASHCMLHITQTHTHTHTPADRHRKQRAEKAAVQKADQIYQKRSLSPPPSESPNCAYDNCANTLLCKPGAYDHHRRRLWQQQDINRFYFAKQIQVDAAGVLHARSCSSVMSGVGLWKMLRFFLYFLWGGGHEGPLQRWPVLTLYQNNRDKKWWWCDETRVMLLVDYERNKVAAVFCAKKSFWLFCIKIYICNTCISIKSILL